MVQRSLVKHSNPLTCGKRNSNSKCKILNTGLYRVDHSTSSWKIEGFRMEALEKHCLGRESDIQLCAFLHRVSPEEKKEKREKLRILQKQRQNTHQPLLPTVLSKNETALKKGTVRRGCSQTESPVHKMHRNNEKQHIHINC